MAAENAGSTPQGDWLPWLVNDGEVARPLNGWARYVCCLASEDGQGSGSAGPLKTRGPLHGIWQKPSKGPCGRQGRVLQKPSFEGSPRCARDCAAQHAEAKLKGKPHRRLPRKGHR